MSESDALSRFTLNPPPEPQAQSPSRIFHAPFSCLFGAGVGVLLVIVSDRYVDVSKSWVLGFAPVLTALIASVGPSFRPALYGPIKALGVRIELFKLRRIAKNYPPHHEIRRLLDDIERARARAAASGIMAYFGLRAPRPNRISTLNVPTGDVFICYRRVEAHHVAGRIKGALDGRCSDRHIFLDTETPGGENWRRNIRARLDVSSVMLVVIGPNWLSIEPDGKRRIDDPDDVLRFEIEEAFAMNLLIVPVLVDGAGMPARNDLPTSLVALADRQAVEIRHSQFDRDLGPLVDALNRPLLS